jgi:hypothetical protein
MELASAAGHRMSDAINQALTDGFCFTWMAFRLDTGKSDGVHYLTRADAVRHQLHESLCAYILVQPCGATPRIADGTLRFYRAAYDSGHRIVDPETPDYILPLTNEDMSNKIARLFKKAK